ncbi:hypothetical protein [Paenibacillus oryzisoli]|nr:hypothetical protein [Paenibacillus oryzisoli]
MKVTINGKPIEEVFKATTVKSEYSDAQGWAVMITGFEIVAFLLNYWGWI